jgi:glycosyltransferase involved in cell wall biosynthesis
VKISVCMATYNGEKYIMEQLRSILSQLGDNDEVVISDDGSDDSTLDIVRNYSDDRIKVVVNESSFRGVVSNFNNALMHATGDIVFLSDQDDIWLDCRVSNALDKLGKYDLVVSNCKVIDPLGKVTQDSYFSLTKSGPGFCKNLFRSTYLGCGLAFNKKVLECILPIPCNLAMYHDWWIGFLAEVHFDVFFDERPSFLYRRHDLSTSTTLGKSKKSFLFKIFSRLQLLYMGLIRLIEKRYAF